ncbi:MAG: M12 family metallo-peptidase [Planctomycetota bacterium]|nr:M12 family metallo-peptidase [Planctomycetota bacterium]
MLSTTLLLLAVSLQSPVQGIPKLFSETQTAAPIPSIGIDEQASKSRLVTIDVELLSDTMNRTNHTGSFLLNFFDGDSVPVSFGKIETAYGDGWVWHGAVEGDQDSSALFSVTNGVVVGTVRYHDRLFRINTAGNGLHRVSEVDEALFKPCGTNSSHEIHSTPSANSGGGSRNSGGNPDVDIMIVYTTKAMNNQGGINGMNSLINLAVTETNNGYNNSQVNQRLNLVHSEEMVGYTEPSSFSTMLSNLRGKNDGKMDNVHTLRDQYGADVVSLFVNGSQYCGIAYLMTNVSHSFESNAFNVVSRSCATGYYSTGHELGHNMGSAHDRANAGGASHSYAYGFRTSNNRYRTIMAYSPGTRVNRWSNPNITYGGYSMGVANSEENWRSLNDNASVVSGWRTNVPPAPVLVVPSLIAGWQAVLEVNNADPNDQIIIGYSVAGGGPTNTAWGQADLSPPILNFPTITANSSGIATYAATPPPASKGMTVWLHAIDITSGLFTNSLSKTVL